MANNQINIVMTLTDNVSKGMTGIVKTVDDAAKSFNRFGKDLQQVGRQFAFIGGAGLAPFVAAMAQAKSSSVSVANQVAITSANFEAFNHVLAEAAVPTVKSFNAVFSKVVDIFIELDPQLKENIAKWALVASAVAVAGGAVLIFTGVVVRLIPILAALAVAFKALEFLNNVKTLGFGEAVKKMGQDIQNAAKIAEQAAKSFDPKKFGDDAAKAFDQIKKSLDSSANSAPKASRAFVEVGKAGVQALTQIGQALQQHLGDTLFNAVTGKLGSIKAVFQSFAEDVIKILTRVIARLIIIQALNAAVPGAGSAFAATGAFHQGGVIKAHSGLAPDEVPIIAQTGEGVLSRKGMAALGGSNNLRRLNNGQPTGGGGTTVNPIIVFQTWDTSDILRNKKTIEQIVVNSLSKNGDVRKAVRQFS